VAANASAQQLAVAKFRLAQNEDLIYRQQFFLKELYFNKRSWSYMFGNVFFVVPSRDFIEVVSNFQ
jgi:hypothetical protein